MKNLGRDLSDGGQSEDFLSLVFITRDADEKPRSVVDSDHLSNQYDRISTKTKTLEGFSASLLPGDRILTMDLKAGYNHFRLHNDIRRYFVVSIALRWLSAILPLDCAPVRLDSEWVLVLSPGQSFFDHGQATVPLSGMQLRRRLCVVGRQAAEAD
jgi:hypothetical protein